MDVDLDGAGVAEAVGLELADAAGCGAVFTDSLPVLEP